MESYEPLTAAIDGSHGAGPGAMPRIAVVDIETSGLSLRRHRILQVAAVIIEGGSVVNEWSSLVKLRWPLQRLGPRHVHGITRGRLRGAPPCDAVLAELAEQLTGSVFVAHNAAFDWSFIERAARRQRVQLPDVPRLCTLRMSRRLDPERLTTHRLADLCARYDVVNERPHDALHDARATAAVLTRLLAEHGVAGASDLAAFYEPAA